MKKKIITNQQEQITFGVAITLTLKITVIDIKKLSIERYLNKIRPYLKDVINDLKKPDMWKIELTITTYFISSNNNNEEHAMYSKNDNVEFMIYDNAD